MFWKNFVSLCNKHHKSPNRVCADLGYSAAIATKWKNGSAPRYTTLDKIADYFGITVEDLLRDPDEQPTDTAPAVLEPSSVTSEIYKLIDELTVKELRELTEQIKDTIKNRK